MGERANLVVVRDGDWRLYYDHWCAIRLDVELFWGPVQASAFVEQREALEDRGDWLDEVWCEGGAVIDHDRRVLLWFGGEDVMDDIPRRRALLGLMAPRWAGWEVRWAAAGIVELGAHLEIPAEKFLVEREADKAMAFQLWTDYPEYNDILLTVRERGAVTVTRVYGDQESLELGESRLEEILAFPRSPALDWSGDMPRGGLHLDLDGRGLDYWFAQPAEELDRRVARAWPGWRCRNLGDRYEEHLRLAEPADICLPRRDTADLQRAVIDRIRRACHQARTNPARELLSRLEQGGLVSPWTDESRGSVGAEIEKLRVLDEIQRPEGSDE